MRNVPIVGMLAGLAMFVWEAVAHTFTPLGEMGLSTLPNEAAARAALAAQLGAADGLYIFPAMQMGDAPTPGPSGLLLYHPAFSFSWSVMGWEALVELVMGLALAMLIGLANVAGFGRRMAIACLVGVSAAFAVSPSYTIWFGFPSAYTLAQMIVAFGDYVVAGAVIAALLRRPAATVGA
jgi:hypothetical protein